MCVHGACQRIVNPQVKKELEINNISAAVRADAGGALGAAAEAASAVAEARQNKSIFDTWSKRSDYVKKDYLFQDKNYGNLNLHYLMGMFGITASFNDSANTTLDMVKEKLSEAARWAEENEEFLLNN